MFASGLQPTVPSRRFLLPKNSAISSRPKSRNGVRSYATPRSRRNSIAPELQRSRAREERMKLVLKASLKRFGFGSEVPLLLAMLGGLPFAWSDPIPAGWQAINMKPIGYSSADG